MEDVKGEVQGEREELLDTVRQQGYELKWHKRIVRMLMRDEDIARIKVKSQYDENAEDWVVPPFMLKGKEVTLPQLKKNAYEVMEKEKENRDVHIEGDSSAEENEQSAISLNIPKRTPHSSMRKHAQNNDSYTDHPMSQPPSKRVVSRGRV